MIIAPMTNKIVDPRKHEKKLQLETTTFKSLLDVGEIFTATCPSIVQYFLLSLDESAVQIGGEWR